MVRAKKNGDVALTKPLILLSLVAMLIFVSAPATAQKMKEPADSLDHIAFINDGTWLTMNGSEYSALGAEVPSAMVGDIEALRSATGIPWIAVVDRITGKPSILEGGMPWIPGTGMNNNLKPEDFGITALQAAKNEMPLEKVDEIAKNFLRQYPNLFNVDEKDLELAEAASGPVLDYLYNVNYRWTYNGLPVENAWLNFHLNSGNLVMFGATYISDSIKKLDPVPALSSETANEIMWSYIGEKPGPNDEILEPGYLVVQPMSTGAVLSESYFAFGEGMLYRLVYVIVFRREGVVGTWEARIDAHTGELISFKDINAYGKIQGGVYKTDKNPTQTEVIVPFPYANYSGTTSFANAVGEFTGTTGTSTMTGRTGSAGNVGAVKVSTDYCGSISLAADGTGLINFGTSTGTDCTTPGVGGSGNTHSARTQYWNQTMLKIKAYTYMGTNTWLQACQSTEVNYNSSCNAYWTGGATGYSRFFRSSTNCGNTGELPGVSLHEFSHGLDYNDGNGFSPEGGTGEVYGDTGAMLQTHQSCMGGGFFKSYNTGCGAPPSQGSSYHNCTGYGNCCTDCSGVREAEYTKHTSATRATPNNFNKVNCSTNTCVGPCNRECHCENAPGIQANWDLVTRSLPTLYGMDLNTAWQYLDEWWYASASNRLGAFVCGANTSTATGNLFNQYRVVDDCDGVLTNGTPHAAGIWQALGTWHEIGNSSAVNTDNNCGCASLSTPSLSGAAGSGQVTLNWSAITGASSYDVYRNETSCSSGYTKVGNTTSLSFTDSPLSNGVTYYYTIQANGTGSCPPSSMSNCVTLTPAVSTCSMTVNVTPDGTSTVCANSSITFTATPSGGTSPYTYQWTEDGVNISGATSSTRAVTKTTAQSHTYNCKVSDSGSCDDITDATASTGTWVAAPTSVDVTPNGTTSVTVCGNIVFTATVTGGVSPQYQWTENSSNISGATSSTYTASKSAAGTYTYNCKVNNTGCSTTVQDATASTGTWTALGAPSITSVTDVTACAQSGVQVNFTSGSGAASHDLYRDGASVVTGYTSGATYNPGDSSSHSYVVRAINGSCYTNSNSMNGTDVNDSTTPTISGANANTCPATTVALSTQNGMSSYQWYLGGSPIGGANAYQYTVTASGSYTVSYTNGSGCSATSAAHVVTISACAPNIVYSTHGTLTQVTGNGDSYYDLGEKWSVQVTLQNAGNVTATNVTATLAGNGIEVCEPVQSFGNLAVMGIASATYEFVISPTFTPCGVSIGFDVTTKTSTELTPAGTDELDVFSITVGAGGSGTSTVFGPDDDPYNSGYWTFGGASALSAAHCSPSSDNFVRLTRDQYMTKTAGISTVGYTNIHVIFDRAFNSCESGDQWTLGYSTNGSTYTTVWTQSFDDNNWHCATNITLPVGAEGASTLYIRFYMNGNSGDYGYIDNVSIIGDSASWDCSYVGSGTCEACVTPGTPVINGITDVNTCAQSGVQVNYTPNTPYTTHDLYVDGSIAVSDYVSGATYNPGNTSSHNYVVRAINGLDTCYADSSLTAGTDANDTPGAPTVTAVNDVSACAQSGVQVVYTAGSGATSHNLYDNGSLAVTGYASGATYDPGNTASHTYTVYAVSGTCTSSVSNSMAGTDASNTPVPTISGANSNTCPATTVALTTENGMSSYQWYVGGSPIGGANAYQYTVTASGTYTVSYTNGSGCSGTSAGHAVTISSCAVVPGEVAVGSDFTWTGQTIGWTANADATGYRVYRGLMSNLSALCDGTNDFCTRNDAASTSLDVTGDDPSGQAGRCFYYLITGYSGAGEGPAGTATCETRQVNQSGVCP